MRLTLTVLLLVTAGCTWGDPYAPPSGQAAAGYAPNPAFLASRQPEPVWETLVDVVDDYFEIEREEPVRQIGGVLTEGRLDTLPEVGSTVFEPWRGDSASPDEQLESTLQSIRRYARVTVKPEPARGGYWVEVAVFKELEDVAQPAHSTAGAATFRNDSSLTRVANPVGDEEIHRGWIPIGRDAALEARILADLRARQCPAESPQPGYQPFWR